MISMTRKQTPRTIARARELITAKMREYESLKNDYPKGTQEAYLCEGHAFGLYQALQILDGKQE
jgi:hypothetical protein